MNKLIILLAVFLAACGGGGGGGGEAAEESPYKLNQYRQLAVDPFKQKIACPAQTAQTLVAFVFGQSNAANSANERSTATDTRVINYYRGKCYIADDPLLGSTGKLGSQWVPMANKLLTHYDTVILIPFAIGGTGIAEWAGHLNAPMLTTMNQTDYQITHFLWHQGESDALDNTPQANYAAALSDLIWQTKALFPASKFYASVATYCQYATNPAIQAAQMSVVDPANGVFQGVNTDLLTTAEYRRDGCHLTKAGADKAGEEWAALLVP